MPESIVILAAARTPMGAFQGDFATLAAHDLGGVAIKAVIERAAVAAEAVDEVLFGNCLIAGQGQAPARQAGFKGGLPASTGAITLSKMCGSAMAATLLAHDQLLAGSRDLLIAGGMESMSNAPYLLQKGRRGYRMGHDRIFDHMLLDGLEDAYQPGRAMGTFGEQCAAKYGFSRQAQDAFAIESVERAQAAVRRQAFAAEIAPVRVQTRTGEHLVDSDEGADKARPDKIAQLRPAFKPDGTITAASSASINDGAAALLLARASTAAALGRAPLARILGHATHAQAPDWFTTAPVGAVRKLLERIGWQVADVELWEINEAFAVVPMAVMAELGIDRELVNVNGGACVLGHPIGASGARIIVTLLHALQARGKQRGIATLCIGGGEATAIAIERI